ncbi:unnamed protein product, partial [Rotaria sordida]
MDPRHWNCSQVIQWLSSFNKNQHALDVFTIISNTGHVGYIIEVYYDINENGYEFV